MEPEEEQNLTSLRTAVENRDASSATKIWRGMTSTEQEAVVFTLLGMPQEQTERIAEPLDAETAVQPVQADQTELIPKSVEDLRGLTGSDTDHGAEGTPDMRIGSTEYWSQWRQRWKWSVLVAVWAMATLLAFNGAFDAFGPTEWVVGIFASVIFSGLLIGTLVNFAVAVIPGPQPVRRR